MRDRILYAEVFDETTRHLSATPFLQPRIVSDDKKGVLLQWHRIYFPPYEREPALKGYTVEVLEPPSKEWKTWIKGLPNKSSLITNLKPGQDYVFRVRGESESGELTEPSPPVPLFRSKVPDYQIEFPWSPDELEWTKAERRRPDLTERETPESTTSEVSYRSRSWRTMLASEESLDSLFDNQASLSSSTLHLEEDDSLINRPYLEMLTCKVPPRMPLEPPELIDDGSDVAWLLWKPATVPNTTKVTMTKSITYTIEMRMPPCLDWTILVEDLLTTKHKITDLLPDRNYVFRVRCYNEFGGGEATLPVTMHRTTNGLFEDYPEFDSEDEVIDWENFDGEMVPPRLPLDKPDIASISNDSLVLTWAHARNPAYGKYSPITYVVEMKEQWARAWTTLGDDLTETRFHVKDIQPTQSYSFRILARNEFGCSEPSMTATLHRAIQSPGPVEAAKQDKLLLPSATFMDPASIQSPPRVPMGRPKISQENGTSLVLTWKAARLPSYVKKSIVTYVIEMREPPSSNWIPIAEDIEDTSYEIKDLKEEQDYMFRVRACNEAGQSEASLPATLYREIDYIKQLQRQISTESSTLLSPDLLSPDESNSFFWDLEPKTPYVPEFIAEEGEEIIQYGVEMCMMRLELKIRAFPPPKVYWYFNDEKIEYGDRYAAFIKPGGIVTLEFPDLSWNDVGEYKCYVENELGFASQMVTLNLAEPPTIVKPMEDIFMMCYERGILELQVDGIPYPSVAWFKDRIPIFESTRVHPYHELPGRWSLIFEDASIVDNGTYECIIENVGGKISCTAQVEVSEIQPVPSYLLFREAKLENHYYVLEEIGRGRHAIIRRLVEKSTGKNFAGKFMLLSDPKEKEFFASELECLRVLDDQHILKVCDAYETEQSLALVTELITGGELIDMILTSYGWTESNAAFYIKQLLRAIDTMKLRGVAHLDIKPANIMYDPEMDCIKLIDFGFAKKIHNFPLKLNYGTPEYASPEVVCSEVITESTDMWSVGVLTYILLSGISPFYGGSIPETLNLVEKAIWDFDEVAFQNISSEAKDFIGKLLQKEPLDRLEIDECLNHPWMDFARKKGQGARLNLTNMEAFHKRDLAMRKKNAVLRCARLESLTKMEFIVPTTPSLQPQIDPETGKMTFPDSREFGEFLDSEARFDWNKRFERRSESEFSLRSKEYLKLVRQESDVLATNDETEGDIEAGEDEEMMRRAGRDRRRLSELDVDHEKLAKMEKEVEWIAASSDGRIERQLNREKEGQVYVMERKPSVGMPKEGYRPIFRAKLTDQVVRIGENVTFMCLIRGRPTVTVAWYKNEEFLNKSNRMRMSLSEDGVSSLTLISAQPYDLGVYKCVARNKMGRTACRARLTLGDNPSRPERPIITSTSAHEALLVWDPPTQDGGSPILFYRVYCKQADDYQWRKMLKTINECAYIGNLAEDTSYIFKVSCQNKFGLSPYSLASAIVKTKSESADSLSLYIHPDYAIMLCRNAETISSLNRTQGPANVVEYYRDRDDEIMDFDPAEQYDFLEDITRGAFSNWKMCRSKRTKELYLSRHTPYETESEDLLNEFNLLVTVQHVNVITVIGAFLHNNIHTVIFEYLDSENILDHLSSRTRYTEDEVARIVTQLLDALQYLHFLCITHMNLQPDNILMARVCPILKLKDFSLAQKIVTPIGKHVPQAGHPEYMAPEVVVGEPAGVAADVWGVGIITTLLLSGETPYVGNTREETLGNIAYNRFDRSIMYENVSKEALKFISKIVKRIPTNRMTVDDCLEHNWLQQSDDIVKTRKENVFMGFKLRNYAKQYEGEKGVSSKFNPTASLMEHQPERRFKMPKSNEVTMYKHYSYKEKSHSQKSVSFDKSYLESKLESNYKRVTDDLLQKSLSYADKNSTSGYSRDSLGSGVRSGLQELKGLSQSSKLQSEFSESKEQIPNALAKVTTGSSESKKSAESVSMSDSQNQAVVTSTESSAAIVQEKKEITASSVTKSQSEVLTEAAESNQKSTSVSKTQAKSLQETKEATTAKAMSVTENKSVSKSQEAAGVTQEKAKTKSVTQEMQVKEQKTVSAVQQSESTVTETSSSKVLESKASGNASEKISTEEIAGTVLATTEKHQSVASATSSVEERKQSAKTTESSASSAAQKSQQAAIESGSAGSTISTDAGATCVEVKSQSSETVQHEEVIEEIVTTTSTTSEVVTSVETTEEVVEVVKSSPSAVQD